MINEEWFKQGSFETYKVPAREKFTVATGPGVIESLEGPSSYDTGHYIMTGPKGEQYAITPEKFNELKTDNGDGTASPRKIIKIAKLADHSGTIKTSWAEMTYSPGNDYIVRHGENDYGVVKCDIFKITYDMSNAPCMH